MLMLMLMLLCSSHRKHTSVRWREGFLPRRGSVATRTFARGCQAQPFSVLHLLTVISDVSTIRNISPFLRSESFNRAHQGTHAAIHVVFAIEPRHLGRNPTWMHSQGKDLGFHLGKVYRLRLGQLVHRRFGDTIASIASGIVYRLSVSLLFNKRDAQEMR
jgi:hypothetical protein